MQRISRLHLTISLIACFGIAQFVCSVTLAVKRYPGDTAASRGRGGYDVLGNFLSDLGKSKTLSGVDNTPSAMIFNSSVIGLGVLLLPFFVLLPTTVERGKTIVRISGTASALGLIGIGLTPYDLYFVAHHVALGLWIGPMFILVIAYLISAAWDGEASSGLVAWTLALAAAIGAYALAGTHGGYVAMQKVTAVISIVWFASIVCRVAFVTVEHITFRRSLVDREARRYMATLERGHRQPPTDRCQAEEQWKTKRRSASGQGTKTRDKKRFPPTR